MQAIGWLFLIGIIAIMLLLWWAHVWAIMKDIAKQDAEEMADKMFSDYIHNMQYRVHIRMRIVDEMKRR